MTGSQRSWVVRGLLVAGALVAANLGARGWPKDREVRYVLGSQAPAVVELDARWSDEATGEGVRDASFRYGRGHAPRVVRHAASLADGRYAVAITVVTDDASGDRRTTDVIEHVELGRDSHDVSLSFDLAPRLARADEAGRLVGGTEP
jgi:hypothetical protein